MTIQISIPNNTPKTGIINLKKYLDKNGPGESKFEIEHTDEVRGQQGVGDLLNSIQAIVAAGTQPLVALIHVLQTYVETFTTEITIGDIKLRPGRNFTPEQIIALAEKIQQNHD